MYLYVNQSKKILKKPLWLKYPKFHDIDEIVCNFAYYFYYFIVNKSVEKSYLPYT